LAVCLLSRLRLVIETLERISVKQIIESNKKCPCDHRTGTLHSQLLQTAHRTYRANGLSFKGMSYARYAFNIQAFFSTLVLMPMSRSAVG
jgi:hypothetical protein